MHVGAELESRISIKFLCRLQAAKSNLLEKYEVAKGALLSTQYA